MDVLKYRSDKYVFKVSFGQMMVFMHIKYDVHMHVCHLVI